MLNLTKPHILDFNESTIAFHRYLDLDLVAIVYHINYCKVYSSGSIENASVSYRCICSTMWPLLTLKLCAVYYEYFTPSSGIYQLFADYPKIDKDMLTNICNGP